MARTLPVLREWNRFFWTSGEDGQLRFQHCAACDRLQHPPAPICRGCGGHDLGTRAVSGGGIVQSHTTNVQVWSAVQPDPFIVAVVAIDEDPSIRLTTNIVATDGNTVEVGTPVAVLFEHEEDVWIPVFEPTGEPPVPLEDEAGDLERMRSVRPMARTDKFEDHVALTGAGMSRIGRKLMAPPLSLTAEAITAAVTDAGLEMADIDGLSTYPSSPAEGGYAEGGITAVESMLGIRPTWHNGGHETPGANGSIIAAMLAVASGLCRHVVCFRTVWQSSYGELVKRGEVATPGPRRVSGHDEFLAPYGSQAVHTVAMAASQHMARYGTTRETLGWIAINARSNAALDPTALYRDPISMDDYLSARDISTPFGLLDCDALCDGSVAVVVSAADAAADTARPVFVEAVGTQITERMEWDQGTLSHEPHVLGPAAHLWTRTSLRPVDVDVAELYDGFTFNCLSWIEALGFCEIGEAKDFLDGGKNIACDGQLPLNTHGGQLSHGRTHGMGLVHEAVTQLRGEAGERQVADPATALVTTGGLTPEAFSSCAEIDDPKEPFMNVDDMIILSIDDHAVEPPDLFENHLPAVYKDRGPRLVRDADGMEHWEFEGKEFGVLGLNATVSWPKSEWGLNPSALAEMRPAAYRIDDRVRDMDRNGVLASMCFPSLPGFSGRRFQEAADKDLALVMLQAYNDWHMDEWCAAHPGRFMPLSIGPTWDMDAMVAELHRVAAKGCRAVSMPELPHIQGLPTYQSEYWDPFFRAVCDLGMVMCLHIGMGLDAIDMGPDFQIDNFMVLSTQVTVLAVQDLLWGPAMRKYPDLKVAFSEGGIGWIPFLMDRVDRHYDNQKWTGQDFGDKRPSDVFREHALACFIYDPTALKLHEDIGIDIIVFETDYPHSDSLWPDAPEVLLEQCNGAGLSDEYIHQVSWKNVAWFLDYDPFSVIPKEKATVGALRATATDVDTSTVSRAEWRARYEANPTYEVASA